MRRALMLAVILAASIAHAGDWGVQLNVDMPLDPANVRASITDPLGFVFDHFDVINLSAFYEQGGWGGRFDFYSSQEVRFGLYRTLSSYQLPLGGFQADTGVYVGYNWNGAGMFVALRTRLLLYGSTGPP